MAKLALDDDKRHSLVRHLDRVGVPKLMRREPAPHAGHRRERVPDAPFTALEDVAHWPPLKAPERVVATLLGRQP